MSNVKVVLNRPIYDGIPITFKAPCDCTAVTGLIVYYPVAAENELSETSKTFIFRDSHGSALTGIGNLFSEGAYVKAILDTTQGYAYLQNADTNSYIEGRFKAIDEALGDVATSMAALDEVIGGESE